MEKQSFEVQKEAALKAAKEQGIIDVVTAGDNGNISLDTLNLATKLMKKHGRDIYAQIELRRKQQKA
ncbi:MAG: hypothetical protein LBM77_03645 [Spirochaetaceae bacterium]|jgi:hypothetical protein|nr:hypothetical protein [Spirochaetaceae bacterium]